MRGLASFQNSLSALLDIRTGRKAFACFGISCGGVTTRTAGWRQRRIFYGHIGRRLEVT